MNLPFPMFIFFFGFSSEILMSLNSLLAGSIPSTYYPAHIPKCSSPLYDKWSDWSLPLYSYQLNFWVRNAINPMISVTRRVPLAGTSTCQFQNPLQTYSLALYTSVAFILQASPLLLPFPTNLLLSCVVSLVLCQSPSSLSYLNSFLLSTCSEPTKHLSRIVWQPKYSETHSFLHADYHGPSPRPSLLLLNSRAS